MMEDSKKRKVEETPGSSNSNGGGELKSDEQHLRLLLEPLRKDQLIDLLVKLGSQYPTVAEEIKGVASADPVHRKLFVRGLAWETTSETLCAVFHVHGEIEEGAVIVDKGRLAVCNLACEGLNSTSVSSDLAQRKLYIGGLSPDISSEALLNFFGRHGEIEEGSVAYDKETNKSRGFGFVTYKTVEAAKKAIDDPNKIFGGRNITVKLAETQKSRATQGQLPAAIVPIAIPIPAGYSQPGKTQAVPTAAVNYASYPPALAAYPVPYQNAPPQYPRQPQSSYAAITAMRDSVGLPAAPPTGLGSYPYYMTKP